MKFDFPPWYRLVPQEFLRARAERAGQTCRDLSLTALLLSNAVDVYYLSGTMQQGVVLATPDGQASPLIRRNAERAAAESPWPVRPISGLSQVVQTLAALAPSGGRLGLALDVMSASEYLLWQKRLPGWELVDATGAWLDQKAIKDSFEREAMIAAGRLAHQAYDRLPELIRPGASEARVAAGLQAFAAERGHIDLARARGAYLDTYTWHVVSGPEGSVPSGLDAPFSGYGNSPAFPLGASLKKIRPGEPVLVDFGVCLDGYMTDQTRTYCLGPAPNIVKEAHACLEAVDRALAEGLTPGAVSGELFELGREIAREHGMEKYYLGQQRQRIKFAGHGIGHELGTPPYILKGSTARVRANEAYALELKIVLDEGPVGLENSYISNPSGPPTWLTPIPNRLFELELD